jgi:F-type H+-transporting ATPase subunit b
MNPFRASTALFLLSISLPAAALAAGGDPNHVPLKELVFPQLVNVTIFVLVLVYFLRKPVGAFFSGKVEKFHSAKNQAEKAKKDAQDKLLEIQSRLAELDKTAQASLQTARADADSVAAKLVEDAKVQAKRMEQDASLSVAIELQRAVVALRQELLNESMEVARSEVKKDISPESQSKLHKDFLQKAQRVSL